MLNRLAFPCILGVCLVACDSKSPTEKMLPVKNNKPAMVSEVVASAVVAPRKVSYVKLDAAGKPLAPNAAAWQCVLDNSTHLIWEHKTADGGLHDKNKTFTNYDDVNSKQIWQAGGEALWTAPTLAQIAALTNSQGYVSAVNHQGWCGGQDWRLPTKEELAGLVDMAYTPTIHPQYFQDVVLKCEVGQAGCLTAFWSSSAYADNFPFAWNVLFKDGSTGANFRYGSSAVRLVRQAP